MRIKLMTLCVRLALAQPQVRGLVITPAPDGKAWSIKWDYVARRGN